MMVMRFRQKTSGKNMTDPGAELKLAVDAVRGLRVKFNTNV